MNKTKFFIVSIQRDYIVRFHAQAEDLVLGFHGYLFHVKKIEAHLFCFSVVPPEEADEAQTSAYTAELKKCVFEDLITSEHIHLESSNL